MKGATKMNDNDRMFWALCLVALPFVLFGLSVWIGAAWGHEGPVFATERSPHLEACGWTVGSVYTSAQGDTLLRSYIPPAHVEWGGLDQWDIRPMSLLDVGDFAAVWGDPTAMVLEAPDDSLRAGGLRFIFTTRLAGPLVMPDAEVDSL